MTPQVIARVKRFLIKRRKTRTPVCVFNANVTFHGAVCEFLETGSCLYAVGLCFTRTCTRGTGIGISQSAIMRRGTPKARAFRLGHMKVNIAALGGLKADIGTCKTKIRLSGIVFHGRDTNAYLVSQPLVSAATIDHALHICGGWCVLIVDDEELRVPGSIGRQWRVQQNHALRIVDVIILAGRKPPHRNDKTRYSIALFNADGFRALVHILKFQEIGRAAGATQIVLLRQRTRFCGMHRHFCAAAIAIGCCCC